MLGASVDVLDQLLKLSVTGDTAKYLVLTLERVCTFTMRLKQPLCPWPSCSEKERRRLRRDLWETVPCSSGQTHTRHSSAETCRNQVPRTYLVKAEPLYHVAALEASSLGENLSPFVPGWQSTSEYPIGTTLNSQQPIKPKSTQVFI